MRFMLALVVAPALAACTAAGPRLPANVGEDDPNHAVPAANTPVGTRAPESEIAISLHDELLDRCRSAALASPHFDFNSADVLARNNEALRAIAACLVNGPMLGARVTLVGHADASGDQQHDAMLARARAESVLAFLVARGVPQVTIRIRATIDAPPLAPEPAFADDSVRGWASRRVDIFVER
jgi:outer membrane protein OmpA-like peptidoglycan-associated protein